VCWWLGLGSSCGGASTQMSREGGLLHLRISKNVFSALHFLLCFSAFSLVSGYLPAKHVFSKYKWN
jgi:hypothetical protein